MLGTLGVNVPNSEGCVTFALPEIVSAAILVVLATLAVVIFALPSMSSAVLVNVAETPVKAGRLTPPENWGAFNAEAADTEAGTTPMVYLVSSAESGVSATAAKPNISQLPLWCYPLPPTQGWLRSGGCRGLVEPVLQHHL